MEIDLADLSRFDYKPLRQFSLGVLKYSADQFGLTRIGDLLDAMKGYNDAEGERRKKTIEIVRRATTLLWNTQVIEADRRTAPELWPLPWDKETGRITVMPEEERQRILSEQANYLNKYFPN